MKEFLLWLSIFVLSFGGLSGGYHVYRNGNPTKVLVAVDNSFALNKEAGTVKMVLEDLDNIRYAEFSVVDSLSIIQDWKNLIQANMQIVFYGVQDLEALAKNAEKQKRALDADEIVFITKAEDVTALKSVPDSRIINLE
jgi:uncharacterized protein related to proFAR isomerase